MLIVSPPDFEKIYRRQLKENFAKLKIEDVSVKIDTFCKRTGYSREEVSVEFHKNPMFRWWFVKDPKKQNIYERTAADYISRIPGVSKFKKYGTNEMFVSSGGVFTQESFRKSGMHSSAKTIDFGWIYENTQFYAAHKYTKDSGGAQGNQYKDLISFIKEANNSSLADTIFLVIADGEFYNGNNGRANTTRIKHLKVMADNHKTFALTTNELEEFLKSGM